MQHGRSDLIGNGAAPVELLALRREAIFTGPDITENEMTMMSLDFSHEVSSAISFSGNLFWRKNDTDSFNGDGSEFAVCEFSGGPGLIEGLEEDDVEELGIDDDDLCEGQFAGADALERFLNNLATQFGHSILQGSVASAGDGRQRTSAACHRIGLFMARGVTWCMPPASNTSDGSASRRYTWSDGTPFDTCPRR